MISTEKAPLAHGKAEWDYEDCLKFLFIPGERSLEEGISPPEICPEMKIQFEKEDFLKTASLGFWKDRL